MAKAYVNEMFLISGYRRYCNEASFADQDPVN